MLWCFKNKYFNILKILIHQNRKNSHYEELTCNQASRERKTQGITAILKEEENKSKFYMILGKKTFNAFPGWSEKTS